MTLEVLRLLFILTVHCPAKISAKSTFTGVSGTRLLHFNNFLYPYKIKEFSGH